MEAGIHCCPDGLMSAKCCCEVHFFIKMSGSKSLYGRPLNPFYGDVLTHEEDLFLSPDIFSCEMAAHIINDRT
jgi:hypothetical protein